MADSTPKSYHTDPTLYLYTSLTAGSSQIITATSRLETILKANRIQFQALDVATDEKARMLWGRRAGKKKLPGLVRMGMIVADLPEVEEWNEYGEIKANLSFATTTQPSSTTSTPSKPPPTASISTPSAGSPLKSSLESQGSSTPTSTPSQHPTSSTPTSASTDNTMAAQMRQLGVEAAQKASDAKSKPKAPPQESADSMLETVKRLDSSGPTGMPPPSGTTESEAAMAPETAGADMKSKADDTPLVGQDESAELEHPHGTMEAAVATMGNRWGDQSETKALEEYGGLEPRVSESKQGAGVAEDGKEGRDEEAEAKVRDATTAADGLPGKPTQDQSAAEGDNAGVSVGD